MVDSSSVWIAQHLLLHLLGHPLQIGHAHRLRSLRARSSVVSLADAPARLQSSVDLGDVGHDVGEDPAGLGHDERALRLRRGRRRDLDVGDDAADRHLVPEDSPIACLDRRATALDRRP